MDSKANKIILVSLALVGVYYFFLSGPGDEPQSGQKRRHSVSTDSNESADGGSATREEITPPSNQPDKKTEAETQPPPTPQSQRPAPPPPEPQSLSAAEKQPIPDTPAQHSPPSAADKAFVNVRRGLSDGHFDIDTASQVYPPNRGDVGHHIHEYDETYDVTYVDLFDIKNHKQMGINKNIMPKEKFVLIIGNGDLSKSGFIEINGEKTPVQDYQKQVAKFVAGDLKAVKTFTIDGSSDQKLKSLKIGFLPDSLLTAGLQQSAPSCVKRNVPGKHGEYRNGALVIQAIAAEEFKIDTKTKTAAQDAGLLWEAAIYWHKDNDCYR